MRRMEREQTTIRLPVELKEQLQQEAEDKKDYSHQTTLRIQTELHKELKIIASQTGLTVSSLLIVAIWWSVLKLKYLLL